ncbi:MULTISPECIES: hypothetical protein [Bacillus amyloliquefaciens group]|uniref:hypothetical protein n=1 Tax=Bacillus amyloliquefaciens group TaxID=1938374 RepID=UPI000CA19239|nr:MULTISPECIES: hypothetical protein [Bacillus amyloliquefaciens group]ATX84696.1 hypothetical protein CU084_16820 [Bacillus velezensis]QOH67528.1 hypothetical protein DKG78_15810 [Bacillus amyloliquefaciens]URV79516.1 hypothetical protein M5C89_20955 [Bacillus velezensis]
MKLAKNALLSLAIVSFIFAPFFNSSASAAGPATKVNKNIWDPTETRITLKVGDVRTFANAGNHISFNPLTKPNAIKYTTLGSISTVQVFAVAKGQAYIEFYDDSFTWRTRYYFFVE